MPEAVRFVVWVPLGASSVRVSVPETEPAPVGEKTTVRVQLAPAARVVPQLLEAMRKPVLSARLEMCSARPPLLVRVRVCAGAERPTPVAAKVSEDGLSETPGGATPVPLRATACERN